MEWMILPLKKYAQFSGRSQRKEYWMWVLFIFIVSTLLRVVEQMLGLSPTMPTGTTNYFAGIGGNGPFSGLFGLAVLVPGLAVTVRRLHDLDRSGWWLLIPIGLLIAAVIFLVGTIFSSFAGAATTASSAGFATTFALIAAYGVSLIVLLVFMCLDGTRGPNRYGPDPKNPQANLDEVFS